MSGEVYNIVGLGELIWDLLPEGKQLGGAPTNFAYISRLFGDESIVASRTGADEAGREAHERLAALGISTAYLQRDATHPTGMVRVTVDAHGEATFAVNENSAWDYLEWTGQWAELASRADAVCFGTLGQRADGARSTIKRFLHATRTQALRIFDVNLRHAFFDAGMLSDSLRAANIVKLNSVELPLVAEMLGLDGRSQSSLARQLLRRFDLHLVAITRGAHGSLIACAKEIIEHPGFPVTVVDTIGAGDAFAAALSYSYLRGASASEMSEAGNRAGAWVATQAGATPVVAQSTFKDALESFALES